MNYTIYNSVIGQIVRIVDTDDIDSQISSNESYLEGAIDDSMYYIANGSAVLIPPKPDQYSVFDYTTKQWVQNQNLAIVDVITQRQKLLYASDWTQIPNNPLTPALQTQWAVYRQALRDVPSQSGYPFNVIWPTPPQG
jgi:Phage tail assembly chaperone protein